MSKLKFDGIAHQITLLDSAGNAIGAWSAYNNVDSHATMRHISNGIYAVRDRSAPHPHAASANGPYGLHGIIRFDVPGHVGIGVHSGRANARHLPGPRHPTMGCIRTSDAAMSVIGNLMRRDALTTIEISNNHGATARAASQQHCNVTLRGAHHGHH